MTFHPATALLLFPAMVVLLEAGRWLRSRRGDFENNSAIEGAVFGLFGLLLAFTFSGAVGRFDAHRTLAVQEANAIGTAYLRLDLLPVNTQPEMRQLFRDYTSSRLHLYDSVGEEVSPESARLQAEIWQKALAGASQAGVNLDVEKLLLPAINDMIDITATRQNSFHMHPPAIVFLLLFAFSCGCAFMAGYGSKPRRRDWVYTLALAATVALTIYATLEIEYPRQGLIRLQNLDESLLQVRAGMR
jgi:hypothetical protein